MDTTIELNTLGYFEEFINGVKVSVKLVKLLSYDKSKNEYLFQLNSEKCDETMTVSGEHYPYQEIMEGPGVIKKKSFKNIRYSYN